MIRRIILSCAVTAVCLTSPMALAKAKSDTSVEAAIKKIAKAAHCQLGVTAIHIETHDKISVNGAKPFFMASTVKIPIALTLLHQVDTHEQHLDKKLTVDHDAVVPGSGSLYGQLSSPHAKMDVSIAELMRLMIISSDNTATDLLLQEIKGPHAVAAYMHSLGFQHMAVNRSIFQLFLAASGLDHTAKSVQKDKLLKLLNTVPNAKKVAAWKHFQAEARDISSADEMAQLLVKLYDCKLVSKSSSKLLLHTMSQCRTGTQRIKGLLPPQAQVAHKTGTWTISKASFIKYPGSTQLYRFANDVGIITLPQNKGHIAIAVFVKSKSSNEYNRERVIAQVSRKIYDHFLQTPSLLEHKH